MSRANTDVNFRKVLCLARLRFVKGATSGPLKCTAQAHENSEGSSFDMGQSIFSLIVLRENAVFMSLPQRTNNTGLRRLSMFGLVAIVEVLLLAASASANEMRLKNFWNHAVKGFERVRAPSTWRPYFTCNYTNQTCQRGFRKDTGVFFYTVLDGKDRKNVLGHFFCVRFAYGNIEDCLNFDTGVVSKYFNNIGWQDVFTVTKEDMPENCIPECDSNKWIDQAFQGYPNIMFTGVLKSLPVP
jgi:hypothetical protein